MGRTKAWLAVIPGLVLAGCRPRYDHKTNAPDAAPGAATGALPAILPALRPRSNHDDPSADGWDSEAAALAVTKQLAELKHRLTANEITAASVAPLLAPGFQCGSLTPRESRVEFDDGNVLVRRGPIPPGPPAYSTPEAFAGELRKLRTDGDAHAFIKIVGIRRVSEDAGRIETTLDFELDERRESGRRQVNALWEAHWTDEAAPRLVALSGSPAGSGEFEEILGRTEAGLVDATRAVFKDVPAWRDQLLHGIDHWTARIEMHLGVEINGMNGVALGDIDGDGLDDLYYCETGGVPNRLFRHCPDGTLEDVTEASGVGWLDCTQSALFVDLDNDGDQDLVVATTEAVLFHDNDGRGRFTLRSTRIQPGGVAYGMAAADYNQDGLLDLFVACYHQRRGVNPGYAYARPVPYHEAENGAPNVLYRNDGGWRFAQATKAVGLDVNNRRFSFAPAWNDFDDDGDMDLYVANDFGSNNLYRAARTPEGIMTFTDAARDLGADDPGSGMSACWGDFDNDGRQDLYVGNMFSSAGNRITRQTQFMPGSDAGMLEVFRGFTGGNTLLRQRGNGTFESVEGGFGGVAMGRWAWGSLFADLNNDGRQDILVANGYITQEDTHDL